MIKLVGLFKRKAEMPRDAFVNRYETIHAPLAAGLLPFISRYSRSFVAQELTPDHIAGWTPAFKFDVMTEVWYESMKAIEDQTACLDGEAGDLIAADEDIQFDREEQLLFLSEEKITPAELLAPRPSDVTGEPPIKLVAMMRRRPGMTREAFIEYYEQGHAKMAVERLRRDGRPLFARYTRTFPLPGSVIDLPYMIRPPMPLEFDVITEMWFWNEADHRAFLALLAEPEMSAIFTADEERLFDRGKIYGFMAEEFVTPSKDLKARAVATV